MTDYEPIFRTAYLSDDGRYRYTLGRAWRPRPTRVVWIMLNPSIADASVDDPTIRRCMGFARDWGYGGITVVNLFAFRTPHPRILQEASSNGFDVVGPENNEILRTQASAPGTGLVVAAWGANRIARERGGRVRSILEFVERKDVHVLGLTKAGEPKHPLYISGDTQPQRWT